MKRIEEPNSLRKEMDRGGKSMTSLSGSEKRLMMIMRRNGSLPRSAFLSL